MACLLAGCMLLPAISAQAKEQEEIWKILSPLPNADVNIGEVFLAVEFKQGVTLEQNSVQVYLDDYLISSNIKVSNNKITMLYLLPLKPGKHTFEIRARAANSKKKKGWLPSISWSFRAKDPRSTSYYTAPDTFKTKAVAPPRYELKGNLLTEYKHQETTGTGRELLQQTPYQRNISLDMVARAGQVSFPVRIFNTADEITYQRGIQSRNYYQAGIQTKYGEVFGGDMNPMLDRLALTGTRVFGGRLMLKRNRTEVHLLNGILQRAMEGSLHQYKNTDGFPPATLQTDSSYFIPGTYRQNVSALRLAFGNKQEGGLLGINVVKVKDAANSIKYGQNPQDNLVLSLDQTFSTNQNKMKFNAGLAYSFYTANTNYGTVEKDWVDSAYDVSLPFSPPKYRDVFVINSTTRKPSKQSFASYVNTTFGNKHHTFGLEARYIGTGYTSLANPFLQNDVQGFGISDRIVMWKRKINLNLRYNFQNNNLIRSHFATINQHIGNASLMFAPSPKLPQVFANYTTQYRISPPTLSLLTAANDLFTNYGGGLNYNFAAFKCNHGFSLQYNKSVRDNRISPEFNNQIDLYSAGINEQLLPINLMLDFSYARTIFKGSNNLAQPMYETINTALRYKLKKLKTDISTGAYINHYFATAFSNESLRNTFTAAVSCQRIKGFVMDVEAGYSPFRDKRFAFNNYDYSFVTGRLTYSFNYK